MYECVYTHDTHDICSACPGMSDVSVGVSAVECVSLKRELLGRCQQTHLVPPTKL